VCVFRILCIFIYKLVYLCLLVRHLCVYVITNLFFTAVIHLVSDLSIISLVKIQFH